MTVAYSLDVRMRARHNWAVLAMSDEENCISLGLLDAKGKPNQSLINVWRKNSLNPSHKMYPENWEKFRDDYRRQQEKEKQLALQKQIAEETEQVVAKSSDFRMKHFNRLEYLMFATMREVFPKKIEMPDKTVVEKMAPDMFILKALKLASEAYSINSKQYQEALDLFFASGGGAEDEVNNWADMIAGKYSDATELENIDPAMSADFKKMTDEEFKENVLKAL